MGPPAVSERPAELAAGRSDFLAPRRADDGTEARLEELLLEPQDLVRIRRPILGPVVSVEWQQVDLDW